MFEGLFYWKDMLRVWLSVLAVQVCDLLYDWWTK